MNAPVQVAEADAIADIEDFLEVCEQQGWFYSEGWIPLQIAVDNLQYLAERWGLVDLHGQDEIQAAMSFAFAAAEPVDDLPTDYAAQIVRQWELADPRDRWKHTGEPPPKASAPPRSSPRTHSTPDSVIDAFFYVARQGDRHRLARWLADHPADKAELFKLWKAKRC
jgi:hypothetical protein